MVDGLLVLASLRDVGSFALLEGRKKKVASGTDLFPSEEKEKAENTSSVSSSMVDDRIRVMLVHVF